MPRVRQGLPQHSKDEDHTRYRQFGRPANSPAQVTPPAPASPPKGPVPSTQPGSPASPVPSPSQPPGEPFSKERVEWTFDQLSVRLAGWQNRRRLLAAPKPAPSSPPPSTLAASKPGVPAEPPPDRLEDYGPAYWKAILGPGYIAPKERRPE
jgi:hypothetical protein